MNRYATDAPIAPGPTVPLVKRDGVLVAEVGTLPVALPRVLPCPDLTPDEIARTRVIMLVYGGAT